MQVSEKDHFFSNIKRFPKKKKKSNSGMWLLTEDTLSTLLIPTKKFSIHYNLTAHDRKSPWAKGCEKNRIEKNLKMLSMIMGLIQTTLF